MTELIGPCQLLFEQFPTIKAELWCIYDMLNNNYNRMFCQVCYKHAIRGVIFTITTAMSHLTIICLHDRKFYELKVANIDCVAYSLGDIRYFIMLCEQPLNTRWKLHYSLCSIYMLYDHYLSAFNSHYLVDCGSTAVEVSISFRNNEITDIIITHGNIKTTVKNIGQLVTMLTYIYDYY